MSFAEEAPTVQIPLGGSPSVPREGARVEVLPRLDGRVVVVGLGYVGLPASLAFARAGFQVTGADLNRSVVDAIRKGRSPLPDAASEEEIAALVREKRFTATTATARAVAEADFVTVCVPTPVGPDRKPDLVPLEGASHAIGAGLRRGTVVSYESTTFPGCTDRVAIPILEGESGLRAGQDFGVAYCPERVVPGEANRGTTEMPRVLGALDEASYRVAYSFYSKAIAAPIVRARNLRTAEASKILENVQRDVNLALINEFARMCPRLGLDVHEVIDAAKSKFNFVEVRPGPGVGGHCIPVDPYYLIEESRRVGFEPRLMVMAREVNDESMDAMARQALTELATVADPAQGKLAILGLAYKGGVGDLRESPAVHIAGSLLAHVGTVRVHDPRVPRDRGTRAAGVPSVGLEEAVRGAHAILILTDHPEFRELDWAHLGSLAAPGAVLMDARNVVRPEAARAAGLRYWGLGRVQE